MPVGFPGNRAAIGRAKKFDEIYFRDVVNIAALKGFQLPSGISDVMGWNDVAVEIRNSFLQEGKEENNATITDFNTIVCLYEGYRKGKECPIVAFVYKHLEENFKELFDL